MVIVMLAVAGLCLGSFVNALVWRLHEQSKKTKKIKGQDLSILQGRSMCVHCHHTLAWYDLLPVFSWLSLGGKCRYCRKKISWQYPAVELLTAGLFAVSYAFWPWAFTGVSAAIVFGLWLALLVGFMALVVYDIRWMLLPDKIVFPLVILASFHVLLRAASEQDAMVLTNALLGVACSAGLFYALFQVSKGKWIGGGDVKLGIVLGLVLGGPLEALLMLFLASTFGSIVGLPQMLRGRAKTARIPFGPFLIMATIVVYLFGPSLLDWYKQQFLFV